MLCPQKGMMVYFMRSMRRLRKFAKQIESKKYKSDLWLKENWNKFEGDEFNSPELGFIPDLINRKIRYIVECDGSIHSLPEVIDNDLRKESIFIFNKYRVFRVHYLDIKKLNEINIEVLRMLKKPKLRKLSNIK